MRTLPNRRLLQVTVLLPVCFSNNMLWVPDDILEKYGDVQPSMLDGPIAKLFPKYEKEIVRALKGYGYTCIRDDDLVNEACGFL